jgi:hypothetical protein
MKKIALLLVLTGCRSGFNPIHSDGSDSGTSDETGGTDASDATDAATESSEAGTADSSSSTSTGDGDGDGDEVGDGDGDGDTGEPLLGEHEVCDPLNPDKPNGLCEEEFVCSGPFWDGFNEHFEFRCEEPPGGSSDGAYGSNCFSSLGCQTGMGCMPATEFPEGICTTSTNCCMPMCKQEAANCPSPTSCNFQWEPVHPDYMSAGYGICLLD